ncbi:MAG: c-type cytochrome [Ketobacteraceae bacterium]|nr:c-type cytochrome [Ketobacteraceae bacterium]
MKKLAIASAVLAMGIAATAQAEAPAKYNMYCVGCHATGAANAPKTGDKAEWDKRLEAAGGMDGLIASAKKGKGAMPPMGLCSDCTDEEFKAMVEFMINGK